MHMYKTLLLCAFSAIKIKFGLNFFQVFIPFHGFLNIKTYLHLVFLNPFLPTHMPVFQRLPLDAVKQMQPPY